MPPSTQLKELADTLEAAHRLYGSAKEFAKHSLSDPAAVARCVQAAKQLTPALRLIQTLA